MYSDSKKSKFIKKRKETEGLPGMISKILILGPLFIE